MACTENQDDLNNFTRQNREEVEHDRDLYRELQEQDEAWENEYREDQFLTDAEADADVLRSAGWGTDEDYGYYGDPWEDNLIGGDSDLYGEC